MQKNYKPFNYVTNLTTIWQPQYYLNIALKDKPPHKHPFKIVELSTPKLKHSQPELYITLTS